MSGVDIAALEALHQKAYYAQPGTNWREYEAACETALAALPALLSTARDEQRFREALERIAREQPDVIAASFATEGERAAYEYGFAKGIARASLAETEPSA
jgi:hypothetical protein